jgi:hypothetical protein
LIDAMKIDAMNGDLAALRRHDGGVGATTSHGRRWRPSSKHSEVIAAAQRRQSFHPTSNAKTLSR